MHDYWGFCLDWNGFRHGFWDFGAGGPGKLNRAIRAIREQGSEWFDLACFGLIADGRAMDGETGLPVPKRRDAAAVHKGKRGGRARTGTTSPKSTKVAC